MKNRVVLLRRLRRHAHRAGRAAHRPGDDRRPSAAASSPAAIRDPLTGTAVREQHDSGRTASIRSRRNIAALLPLPNTTGGNNFIRQPNVEDELGPLSSAASTCRRRQRQPVRPLHLERSLPLRAGLVRRRPRRHVDVGVGPQLPEVERARSAAGPRCFGAGPGQRGALLVRARHQRRHPGSVRRRRQRADRLQGRAEQSRRSSGGIVGIDIAGHIRLGSPNFMPKFQHTNQLQWIDTLDLAEAAATSEVRRRPDAADDTTSISTSRRRAATCASTAQFTGNAFADFLLGYVQRARADQRLRRQRSSCGRSRSTRRTTGRPATS